MKQYEPLIHGLNDEWLKLDEEKRIALVKAYHENLDEYFDEESLNIHSVMHVIVENQVAEGEEYVANTIARITRQGLSEHEAVHAVAAVMSEEIYNTLKGNTAEFSTKKYRRKLEKLTAKRWRKGQY